jgi:hypothetical protein
MTQWPDDPTVEISLNTEDKAEITVTFIHQAVRTRHSNVREIQVAPPLRSASKQLYSTNT